MKITRVMTGIFVTLCLWSSDVMAMERRMPPTQYSEQKLTDKQLIDLVSYQIDSFPSHREPNKVTKFHPVMIEMDQNAYYVLATYDLNAKPRGMLSIVQKEVRDNTWHVTRSASTFLESDRGFDVFTLYPLPEKGKTHDKTVVAGFVHNPAISKIRVQHFYDGGTTTKTTYLEVKRNNKAQLLFFGIVDRIGVIRIDGLSQGNQSLYGWGQIQDGVHHPGHWRS